MTNSRATPAVTATTPSAAGHTRLPGAWHEQAEYETEAAYWAGYAAALHHVAAGYVELDTAWRRTGQPTHEQRVAERLALFEQCAARLAERLGRPAGYTYPGGPVPWDTSDRQPQPALREVA